MTKAFAYLRVSGKAQVEGDGFVRQESSIRAYVKRHGIKLENVFKEEGVSGSKDIINRPAFIKMMEALHANGVKLVLVESLGRLARDLMIQETILHDLKMNGLQLVSVSEPDLCSDDPSRKLMRQIMGAFHEYEKQMIVIKLRGARQRAKLKRGNCEGRKAFGYYPGENEIMKRIFDLAASGETTTNIAKILGKEGVKARGGGQWLQPTISKLLTRKKRSQEKRKSL